MQGRQGLAQQPGNFRIASGIFFDVGMLAAVEALGEFASDLADEVIARYTRGELDSVYILFNEFKSVIAQRLVVDAILPIGEIGERDVRQSEEQSEEARRHAAERLDRP